MARLLDSSNDTLADREIAELGLDEAEQELFSELVADEAHRLAQSRVEAVIRGSRTHDEMIRRLADLAMNDPDLVATAAERVQRDWRRP